MGRADKVRLDACADSISSHHYRCADRRTTDPRVTPLQGRRVGEQIAGDEQQVQAPPLAAGEPGVLTRDRGGGGQRLGRGEPATGQFGDRVGEQAVWLPHRMTFLNASTARPG